MKYQAPMVYILLLYSLTMILINPLLGNFMSWSIIIYQRYWNGVFTALQIHWNLFTQPYYGLIIFIISLDLEKIVCPYSFIDFLYMVLCKAVVSMLLSSFSFCLGVLQLLFNISTAFHNHSSLGSFLKLDGQMTEYPLIFTIIYFIVIHA